ncbi:hypothetical protein CRG98_036376 [Punica granatum]|uniref:Uncharacterized protein n=1 Tax=Punica granatum TaxID=22663 RepID=A0A2I0IHQ3_PUNGR|nr:hypothetical protein CRG98_036376 [Punica granatum]
MVGHQPANIARGGHNELDSSRMKDLSDRQTTSEMKGLDEPRPPIETRGRRTPLPLERLDEPLLMTTRAGIASLDEPQQQLLGLDGPQQQELGLDEP